MNVVTIDDVRRFLNVIGIIGKNIIMRSFLQYCVPSMIVSSRDRRKLPVPGVKRVGGC